MLFKKICAVAVLSLGAIASAQAADKMYDFKFQEAVNRAVADGVLDGSVKFYLAGTKSGGKVIEKGLENLSRIMLALLRLKLRPCI